MPQKGTYQHRKQPEVGSNNGIKQCNQSWQRRRELMPASCKLVTVSINFALNCTYAQLLQLSWSWISCASPPLLPSHFLLPMSFLLYVVHIDWCSLHLFLLTLPVLAFVHLLFCLLQVLARSSPTDKFNLVKLLKKQGDIVAVTGNFASSSMNHQAVHPSISLVSLCTYEPCYASSSFA